VARLFDDRRRSSDRDDTGRRRFDRDYIKRRDDSAEALSALNQATIGLAVVAGLHLLCLGPVVVFAPELSSVPEGAWLWPLVLDLVQALAFAALAVWSRYRPLWATMAAMVVYVAIHLLVYFVASEQAGEGWLLRAVLVALLAWCIVSAWKYERLQQTRAG
jgi:hypothetical protein